MRKNKMIDDLTERYPKLKEIDHNLIVGIFEHGTAAGFTELQIHTCFRMILGVNFHKEEFFSNKELNEIMQIDKQGFLETISNFVATAAKSKTRKYYCLK